MSHEDLSRDHLTRQSRDPGSSALLTDLYQLTMLHSYVRHGMTEPATFETLRGKGKQDQGREQGKSHVDSF